MNQVTSACLIVHHADKGRAGLIRALLSSRFDAVESVSDAALLDFGFRADSSEAEALVLSLAKLGDLSFEVSCFDPLDARRWVFSQKLGLGSVSIDQAGNHLIGENQLMELVRKSAHNGLKMERLIRQVLLGEWDDHFEEQRELQLQKVSADLRVG